MVPPNCFEPIGSIFSTRESVSARYAIMPSLLPPAAQCVIQPDESQQFMEFSLHEAQFRRKGIGFVGQDFEIACDPAVITHVGETRGILCGLEEEVLLRAEIPGLAVRDQGIGDTPKGSLNGLLVEELRCLPARLGQAHLRAEFTAGKDGLSQRSAKAPCACRSREQIRER